MPPATLITRKIPVSTLERKSSRARLRAPLKAPPLKLTRALSTGEALKIIVGNCLTQLQGNHEGFLRSPQPEYLHQMRVALRRLRSALGLFGSIIPRPGHSAITDELKWLNKQLTQARDWDVFIMDMLTPVLAHHPHESALVTLARSARKLQTGQRAQARKAVRSQRYAKLVQTLSKWTNSGSESSEPLVVLAKSALDKRHKRVRRRGKCFAKLNAAQRHRLRIAAKKLRYPAEFFAALYPRQTARDYLKALRSLQSVLGVLNDAATAQRLLKELPVATLRQEAIALVQDRVTHERRAHLAKMKKAWRRFAKQKVFWE